jgi:RimJ/RimL family protein N-acetyltransferase
VIDVRGPIEGRLVQLVLVTADQADAMAAGERLPWFADGYPRPDDVDAASMVPRSDGPPDGWSVRHVIRRADGLAVGTIGFFGPPDEMGRVEVGYGLVESARRQGLITEAIALVVVAAEAAGASVIAHTSPDNVASRAALARTGFTEEGLDDTGELRYARPLSRRA